MKTKYKKLSINTILFALGTFGSKAVAFFLVPLYSNILSTAEFGVSDLITTIAGLLLPLFSISMGESILFYGLKCNDDEDRKKLFKNGFCVVLVGCIFLVILSPLFLFYHAINGYTWFLPAFACFEIIRTYLKYYTKAREKNLIFSIDSIIYAVLVATLNILFLVVFKWGVRGLLSAYIIAEALSSIFLLTYNKGFTNLIKFKIDKETIVMMIKYSAPLMLNSIMWGVSSSSDRIMITAMVSIDAEGIYAVATKIPTIANTIVNLFCQAWTISAYLESDKRDTNFFSNIFSFFSFVLMLATSCILFVERPFMYIYVGEEFRSASNYVPFLLIAASFQNLAAYFGSIIQSFKKNVFMLMSTLIAAGLNLIANFCLIYLLGIQGACVATALSFLVVFVLRFVFSKKLINFDTKTWKIIIMLIAVIGQSVAVSYNFYFVPISIISLLLIILLNVDIFYKFVLYFKGKKTNNGLSEED